MKEKIAKIEKEAKEALEKIRDSKELNELRIKYLGKKSELSNVLKDMANLSKEERPIIRRNSKQAKKDNWKRYSWKRKRNRKTSNDKEIRKRKNRYNTTKH